MCVCVYIYNYKGWMHVLLNRTIKTNKSQTLMCLVRKKEESSKPKVHPTLLHYIFTGSASQNVIDTNNALIV